MFAVGNISTTHIQWTVGEFTYAYMRLLAAARAKDYIITHVDEDSFKLYLPSVNIPLNVRCSSPVPLRISVLHHMGLRPEDMTVQGFAVVAKTILLDCSRDVAARCPRRADCLCGISQLAMAYGGTCGVAGKRPEFSIEGMIANVPPS